MLIGSHVGMKGKDMFLGSVKEALSYGANTFMVYTGAPQNTRRKKIEELRIEDGTKLMKNMEWKRLLFMHHISSILRIRRNLRRLS